MIPYCIQTSDIKEQHLLDLKIVKQLLEKCPDNWTCHDVCEFIVPWLDNYKHYRGHYYLFGHSWLVNEKDQVIIDPHPVGVASGPILLTLQAICYKEYYNGTPVT